MPLVRLLGMSALTLVAVIFLVLQIAPIHNAVGDWFSVTRLSIEAPDSIFTRTSDTRSEITAPTIFGFKTVTSVAGSLVSVAPHTHGQILIFKTPEGIYTLEAYGKVLATSSFPMATPAVSPSGKKIAYAMTRYMTATSSIRFPLGVVVNPEPWNVYVVDRGAGIHTDLGPGFSPVFKDESTLLRITRAGVFASNLSSENKTSSLVNVLEKNIPYLVAPLFVSKNGSILAWYEPANRDGGGVHLYVAEKEEYVPASYAYIQSKPDIRRGFPGGIHVTSNGIYTLVKEKGSKSGTVWKYDFNGTTKPLFLLSSVPGDAIAP